MSIAQTKPTIVKKVTASSLKRLAVEHDFWLVTTDGNWSIHFNRGWNQLRVTDTSRFYRNGETRTYVVNSGYINKLYNLADEIESGRELSHELLQEVIGEPDSIRTKRVEAYNPFSVKHIKPFAFKGHNKIRYDDVVKIIVNKQYTKVQVDSKYTDDYAYDAANDFFKNIELKPEDFLKRYLELYEPTLSINEDGSLVKIYYGGSTYSISL